MEEGWEGGRVELDETSTDKGFSITEKQKTATKRAGNKNRCLSSGQPIKPDASKTLNGEFTMAIY